MTPAEAVRTPGSTAGGKSNEQHDSALLINPKTAAAMLAVGARTLWSLTNCNAIPSRKVGRAVRYSPDELRAWIALNCPTAPGAGDRVRAAMANGVRR